MPFSIPSLNIPAPLQAALILLVSSWSIIWKGLALWHAAKRVERFYFVAILIINTFGVFEIIYLFFLSREKLKFSQIINNLHGVNLKNVLNSIKP